MTALGDVASETLADAEALAHRAAGWLLDQLRGARDRFSVALSGGATPQRLYETLAQAPYRDRMPWSAIHWFWGDERFVSPDDPRSNYGMARRALLSRAPVPAENIHPVPTGMATPEAAAEAYERELRAFYRADVLAADLTAGRPLFDVTLLGLGEDGHTASLFPGTAVLGERTRWAAAVTGATAEPRITLTYPAIASSRAVAFLVAGAGKRDILRRVRAGAADLPASQVKPVGRLHWFVDRAAAGAEP